MCGIFPKRWRAITILARTSDISSPPASKIELELSRVLRLLLPHAFYSRKLFLLFFPLHPDRVPHRSAGGLVLVVSMASLGLMCAQVWIPLVLFVADHAPVLAVGFLVVFFVWLESTARPKGADWSWYPSLFSRCSRSHSAASCPTHFTRIHLESLWPTPFLLLQFRRPLQWHRSCARNWLCVSAFLVLTWNATRRNHICARSYPASTAAASVTVAFLACAGGCWEYVVVYFQNCQSLRHYIVVLAN